MFWLFQKRKEIEFMRFQMLNHPLIHRHAARRFRWAALLLAAAMTGGAAAQAKHHAASGNDGLDLSGYRLKEVYSENFEDPGAVKIVNESELFENGERTRPAGDADWVYESKTGRAWVEDGTLRMGGVRKHPTFGREARYHSVIWNARPFPEDFLLEFTLRQTQKKGLNIVFFAARPSGEGASIFRPGLPKRAGQFGEYIKGAIDNYHISYLATSRRGNPRGFANMRKNSGFHKVADGKDLISSTDKTGPHRIRLLKVDGHVALEVNGEIALEWTDTGETGGPPLEGGYIGLRQMRRSAVCHYDDFKVSKVSEKQ